MAYCPSLPCPYARDPPTHNPFGTEGVNANLLVSNDVIDPISGSVPHRSQRCRVRKDGVPSLNPPQEMRPLDALALAALGARCAGLTGWAVVLPLQRIVRGMVHVAPTGGRGQGMAPSWRPCKQEGAPGNAWCLGSGRSGLLPFVPREAV